MHPTHAAPIAMSNKVLTGIEGFDEMTGGGLPCGRTSLLVGGPGSGKTIFALQLLVSGSQALGDSGIFVTFEEAPERIMANCEGFGWNLASLAKKTLCIVDAQPMPDLIQSGSFDFGGLLAVIDALTKERRATRIVFDGLDIMLALLPDDLVRRREVHSLQKWLLDNKITALITAKAVADDVNSVIQQPLEFLQYMVDCSIILNHRVVMGVSQRNLRVQKYRGSAFDENEAPFVIGKHGFDVAISRMPAHADTAVTQERVSSGVERLDTMLGGATIAAPLSSSLASRGLPRPP